MLLKVRDLGLNLRTGEYDKAYVKKSAVLSMGHSFQVIYVSLNAVGHRLIEIIKLVILALLGNNVFSRSNQLNHSVAQHRYGTRVAKIVIVVGLGLCGFLIARKIKQEALSNAKAGRRKAPCNPIVTADKLEFKDGEDCSLEQLESARVEHIRLVQESAAARDKRMKQAGKDAVDNDPYLKDLNQTINDLNNRERIRENPTDEERAQRLQENWERVRKDLRSRGMFDNPLIEEMFRRAFFGEDESEEILRECKGEIVSRENYQKLPWDKRVLLDANCEDNAKIILGLASTFNQKEVKKKFHELALTYHPDKNKDLPEATAIFRLLITACKTLTKNGLSNA